MTIWKDRVPWDPIRVATWEEPDIIDESGAHFQCNAVGYTSSNPFRDYRECRAMVQQPQHNWGPPVFADTGFGPVGDNQASTIKCECS